MTIEVSWRVSLGSSLKHEWKLVSTFANSSFSGKSVLTPSRQRRLSSRPSMRSGTSRLFSPNFAIASGNLKSREIVNPMLAVHLGEILWQLAVTQTNQRATGRFFEIDFNERSAREQSFQARVLSFMAPFPPPGERHTPIGHDFRIPANGDVATAAVDPKLPARTRVERVGEPEPFLHQVAVS